MRASALWPFAPLLALTLSTCDHPVTQPVARPIEDAVALITKAAVAADVSVLAADSMRGRLTPGPGLAASAEYIESVFRGAGLQAGADFGGYKQLYPCTGASPQPANIIAVRRGSDARLADEWVVLTAHYDHVGVGIPDAAGDSIYNGADDNASGTAGLLGAARAFAALDKAPARSVAFVAVSGEELGFVGSWYFVEHRPSAMARVLADINLDMLGRNAPDLVYALGETLSSLGPIVRGEVERHPELGLKLPVERQVPTAYQASDQLPFAAARIPAIFLHTGSHADLHRPSDELARLDTDKAARVARLAFRVAYAVANDPRTPSWTAVADTVLPRLRLFRGVCSSSK